MRVSLSVYSSKLSIIVRPIKIPRRKDPIRRIFENVSASTRGLSELENLLLSISPHLKHLECEEPKQIWNASKGNGHLSVYLSFPKARAPEMQIFGIVTSRAL